MGLYWGYIGVILGLYKPTKNKDGAMFFAGLALEFARPTPCRFLSIKAIVIECIVEDERFGGMLDPKGVRVSGWRDYVKGLWLTLPQTNLEPQGIPMKTSVV